MAEAKGKVKRFVEENKGYIMAAGLVGAGLVLGSCAGYCAGLRKGKMNGFLGGIVWCDSMLPDTNAWERFIEHVRAHPKERIKIK